MGRLITVSGNPGSGKTTVSLILGLMYAENKENNVIVLTGDDYPHIPLLFSSDEDKRTLSAGRVLSAEEITGDLCASSLQVPKHMRNIGFSGWRKGESRDSYPDYTEEKANEYIRRMKEIGDIVIFDCASYPELSLITETALIRADSRIRIKTLDPRDIIISKSRDLWEHRFGKFEEKDVTVLNSPRPDIIADTGYIDAAVNIPYSRDIADRYIKGTLLSHIKDRKIREAFKKLKEITE